MKIIIKINVGTDWSKFLVDYYLYINFKTRYYRYYIYEYSLV